MSSPLRITAINSAAAKQPEMETFPPNMLVPPRTGNDERGKQPFLAQIARHAGNRRAVAQHEQQAGGGGEKSAGCLAKHHDPAGADPGSVGDARIGAREQDGAPKNGKAQDEVDGRGGEKRKEKERCKITAGEAFPPEADECRRQLIEAGRFRREHSQAEDDARQSERDDEAVGPRAHHHEAGAGADCGARRERQRNRDAYRQSRGLHAPTGNHRRGDSGGADRNVDAAHRQHHKLGEGHDKVHG